MKLEKLRINRKKKIAKGVVIFLCFISAIIYTGSRAKYKVTESIPLVNGTINYKPYDMKMVGIYVKNASNGEYENTETVPTSGYNFNQTKSYCTTDGTNKDTSITMSYSGGKVSVANLVKQGIKYTMGSQHGTGTNSTILGTSTSTDTTTLNGWYNSKIKGTQYEKYVETNGKFCSDRNVASGHSSYPGTTGTATTAFAPGDRLLTTNLSSWKATQTPTLKCTSASDKLTMPVGLITSDEVVFAGGFGGAANSSYYLYTNKAYWTMSPYHFSGSYARVFIVISDGNLGHNNDVGSTLGVRPVINMASDVKLTGSGTNSDPYKVLE